VFRKGVIVLKAIPLKSRTPVAHVFLTLNIGGMEKVGTDLINAIDSDVYENHVVCLKEIGVLGNNLNDNGFEIVSLEKKDGFNLSIFFSLVDYFKKHEIKIVHTNNSGPHFWAGLAALYCGIKVRIHTNHGRNFGWKNRRAWLDRFSSMISTTLVCVSQDSADKLLASDKINPSKLTVVTNGVDTDTFSPAENASQLYSELGLQPDHVVIGSIARFSLDKDQETLIRAFKLVYNNNPKVRLVLVGDGETRSKLELLTADLGLADSIVFTGFRSDIVELLRLFSVYVLSSHTEGLSISLLEAMSTRRPVVATEVGGNPEIVNDGINGLLVRENDVDHLAESLIKTLSDNIFSERLSKAARETVVELFSLKTMADHYQRLYQGQK
jgi:sugar transferase (PEP-CTERM/EpsH1 system associated)